MGVKDSLRELHYADWKAREAQAEVDGKRFWTPQVVERLPDGSRIELDKDNKAYFVGVNGTRRLIKEVK